MAPELVAGGGYGGLIREKPYCALGGGEGLFRAPPPSDLRNYWTDSKNSSGI